MSSAIANTETILKALGHVPAPGADGEDIISLGYVKDLTTAGGKVSFKLEFPAPMTPARVAVEARCKEALREVCGGTEPTIEVSSRIPTSFASDGKSGIAPKVRNFVAVGSGKGGVGKSTISVNLAVGLAKAGARVGILDTDVYGPSVPLLMGVTRQAFMEEMQLLHEQNPNQGQVLAPYVAHGVKTMSLGYLVEPDQAAIWRGPMVHGAVQQLLRDVDWGELDYLIIDMPPGTGDVQLTLSQNVPLAGAVLVCTPQPVAIADANKALNMFKTTKTEVLGMVENMAFHSCSSCGHRDDIFGSQGGKDAAEEWGIPFFGSLPLDTRVRQSGDAGRPVLAEDDASGPLADGMWHVVDRLTAILAKRVSTRPRSLPITRS